jgi:hypothetical protein
VVVRRGPALGGGLRNIECQKTKNRGTNKTPRAPKQTKKKTGENKIEEKKQKSERNQTQTLAAQQI